jgi:hypothetical protein
MCTAIAECHQVDEVKDIRDKAMAMEAYARQAMNTDAERKATEIRIRAERKAGQMMREMERNQGARTDLTSGHAEPKSQSEYAQAKESANISNTQAKRWQKLADVPDKDFEEALSTPSRPSTTGILKTRPAPPAAKKPMDEDALWLWGRLRDFEGRGVFSADPHQLIDELTDSMRSDVMRAAESMIVLCQEILTNERL